MTTGLHPAAVLLLTLLGGQPAEGNLLENGAFEERDARGGPAGWMTAGRSDIVQSLEMVDDPERGAVARLACTHFVGGTPDAHVMLVQNDTVAVERGRWYRISLWARAEDLAADAVTLSVRNRRQWSDVGLTAVFRPRLPWRRFEFYCQATADLAAEESRFQLWFTGTGSLWLDALTIEPVDDFHRTWHPTLPAAGATNVIPNSSFECGGAGWGSWAPGIPGWGTQLYRLHGQWDADQARHGQGSWRLSLSADDLPTVYFDYYRPIAEPVRALYVGHEGWIPVEPGRRYVLSAYVQGDRPHLPAALAVQQAEGGLIQHRFTAGEEWTRVEFAFTPQRRFVFGLVGLDLRDAERPEGTLWVDAVQIEAGERATAYRPAAEVEAFLDSDGAGNIFLDPAGGLHFRLRAHNAADGPRRLEGTLTVTDFRDRVVFRDEVALDVPASETVTREYDGILAGRQGFFRIAWTPAGSAQGHELRAAVIEPCDGRPSAFGMNHAFGHAFLLERSHAAGVHWWRDWSAKWHTVQPEPNGFDFAIPDEQIDRVLEVDGRVLVLLPFPSAHWASSAEEAAVEEMAAGSAHLRERLPAAFAPSDLEAFAEYVRATVRHYWPRIDTFEIFNEPIYTNYSLPQQAGYTAEDYVDLLRVAYQAAKEVAPECRVVGGLGAPPQSAHWDAFLAAGGLDYCDVVNYHIYPRGGRPESYHDEFRHRWETLLAHGGPKPVWMTEFGVYGDDRPAVRPPRVGDATMTAAMREDELTAATDMVKFAAVFAAHGVRKVFYHAGTASALNQQAAGNMLFDFGGTPRKQYAAQAVLSRHLGPDAEALPEWTAPDGCVAYAFCTRGARLVILWSSDGAPVTIDVPAGFAALDLMGNALTGPRIEIDEVPVYLVAAP